MAAAAYVVTLLGNMSWQFIDAMAEEWSTLSYIWRPIIEDSVVTSSCTLKHHHWNTGQWSRRGVLFTLNWPPSWTLCWQPLCARSPRSLRAACVNSRRSWRRRQRRSPSSEASWRKPRGDRRRRVEGARKGRCHQEIRRGGERTPWGSRPWQDRVLHLTWSSSQQVKIKNIFTNVLPSKTLQIHWLSTLFLHSTEFGKGCVVSFRPIRRTQSLPWQTEGGGHRPGWHFSETWGQTLSCLSHDSKAGWRN